MKHDCDANYWWLRGVEKSRLKDEPMKFTMFIYIVQKRKSWIYYQGEQTAALRRGEAKGFERRRLEGQRISLISTRQKFLQIADFLVLSLCKSTWMTWVDLPLLHPGSSEEALRGVRVSLKGLVGPPGGENSQFAYNGWVGVFAPHFAASLVILPPRRRQCYPTETARLIYALRDARLRPSRSWRQARGLPRVLNWWIGWRAFPAHLGKRWY